MKSGIFCLFIFYVSVFLHSNDLMYINLEDPVLKNGIISTTKGAVLTGPNLRLQARCVEYCDRVEDGISIRRVVAEHDLLFQYRDFIFVGDRLEYDLIEHKGTLFKGRTLIDCWFVGGEEVELLPDGGFVISKAYVTTVEEDKPWWSIQASHAAVSHEATLKAKNIKVDFFNLPIAWIPTFTLDLINVKKPPIRYKFFWDQILKQKMMMSYTIYSSHRFTLQGRFDYRFKKGPGAAIETDYKSADERLQFQTKSYGAFDKIVPNEKGSKRFRLQGLLDFLGEKTEVHMSYDRMSDDKMPQDFKSSEFELNTQEKSIFSVSHYGDNYFWQWILQPRLNRFQSINQKLPSVSFRIKPCLLGESRILLQHHSSVGFLDYVFGKPLERELPSTQSIRGESIGSISRPFSIKSLLITPAVGYAAYFYSKTPCHHQPLMEFLGSYQADFTIPLYGLYQHTLHYIEPYLKYRGFTSPSTPYYHHYIFGLEDGYGRQNLIRTGLYQAFYPSSFTSLLPSVTFDLYTNIFIGSTAFEYTIPKLYLTAELNYPSCYLSVESVYNLQQRLWDRFNLRLDATLSENAAFGIEMRHRSRFDWRKSDFQNYILDILKSPKELLHSPVSDGRNTLLSRFHIRLTHLWSFHLETHHGWGRRNEPRYDAYDLKLSTLLTGKWELQIGYRYSPVLKEWVFPSIKLISHEF